MVILERGQSTFRCETAEEAVKIHLLLSGSSANSSVNAAAVGAFAKTAISAKSNPGKAKTVNSVIKKLEPYNGKELSSDEMAKVLGAKSANGLGPKIHQIRLAFTSQNDDLNRYIQKHKPDPTSPTTWTISAAQLA